MYIKLISINYIYFQFKVLMGFLVGNDFIPNLPKFHIANNDLHKLYEAYIDILPTLDGKLVCYVIYQFSIPFILY